MSSKSAANTGEKKRKEEMRCKGSSWRGKFDLENSEQMAGSEEREAKGY